MKSTLRTGTRLLSFLVIAAFLTACGNKNATTATSTPLPTVFYSSMTALKGGQLYTWGLNSLGQLGNSDTTGATKVQPVQITGVPPSFVNISGASVGGDHMLAFTKNGGPVWAWGNNAAGQLGNGSLVISFFPVENLYLPGVVVTGIAAGGTHSMVLDSTHTVRAWGDNTYGQLGIGTGIISYSTPQIVQSGFSEMNTVTKIAAGGSHSLAISDAAGTAYAWGYNAYGELGQQPATAANSAVPVTVKRQSDGGTLNNVVDIAGGGSHSLFLDSSGVVWACGYNSYGQIGDGTIANAAQGVVQVQGLPAATKVIAVAAGLDHSLALMADGTVWAWGLNYYGELGYGAALASLIPVAAPKQVITVNNIALTNIVSILAIGNSSYAVDINGQLWAWGDNTFGQLGTGDVSNRNIATPIQQGMNSGVSLYIY